MDSENTRSNREFVASQRGRTCIFREGILIFPCVLETVRADDWGISLELRPIERPGFIYLGGERVFVAGAWGWGGLTANSISGGQGAPWRLYLDDHLLHSLSHVASALTDLTRQERRKRLRAYLDDYWRYGPRRLMSGSPIG